MQAGGAELRMELRAELSEEIEVREGEHTVTMSRQRALIRRLVTSALAGEVRAMTILLGLCARYAVPLPVNSPKSLVKLQNSGIEPLLDLK